MQAYFHLSHIHICIFFYLRSCVEPNVHSFSYVCVKLRKCGHSLAFSVRLCVVCKPFRKIFLPAKIFTGKETHVKKEKEKNLEILLNHIRIAFDQIFCSIASLMNKSKTKWQLARRNSQSQFKNVLLSLTKVTKTFTAKTSMMELFA